MARMMVEGREMLESKQTISQSVSLSAARSLRRIQIFTE